MVPYFTAECSKTPFCVLLFIIDSDVCSNFKIYKLNLNFLRQKPIHIDLRH